MSDLEEYTRSVEQSLGSPGAGPQSLAVGQYEGLLESGRARLVPAADESEKHHSGYLLGHLVRWLSLRGRRIDESITGATLYGSAVAHSQAQRMLTADGGVELVHQYAALTAERKLGSVLTLVDERMVFAWLCEQAHVDLTRARVARLEHLRVKRHERHGLGPT